MQPPEPLTIEGFSIEPVLADGTTFAGWQTPVRATSQIEISGLRAGVVTVKSDAMNFEHRLPVGGLEPNKVYRCLVTSVSLTGQRATQSCVIDTNTAIRIQEQQLDAVAAGEITADLASNYRLSAAIDWQRVIIGLVAIQRRRRITRRFRWSWRAGQHEIRCGIG